jgi:hypothetical protein
MRSAPVVSEEITDEKAGLSALIVFLGERLGDLD